MTENDLEHKENEVKKTDTASNETATSELNTEEFSEEQKTVAETNETQTDDLKDIEMVKCPRCGKETPKSVSLCMFCGYNLIERPYIPIDKKKAKMIKWAIGIPLIILFIVLFFFLR